MRNKKLIKRRTDLTQGWQFCSPFALEKEGDKEKKPNYNPRNSYLVIEPSTKAGEQGLT